MVLREIKLVKSRQEALRLIHQKAVRVNNVIIEIDMHLTPQSDLLLIQVGKRRFVKLRVIG